jgi:hypothetical protein
VNHFVTVTVAMSSQLVMDELVEVHDNAFCTSDEMRVVLVNLNKAQTVKYISMGTLALLFLSFKLNFTSEKDATIEHVDCLISVVDLDLTHAA